MRPSNYDLQAQAAGHSFAAQDLDAIAARFALRRDETYLYLELLHEPLRLSRADGAAERQHDGVWMPAPFGAAMTAYDLLSNPNGFPVLAGQWCSHDSFNAVQAGTLQGQLKASVTPPAAQHTIASIRPCTPTSSTTNISGLTAPRSATLLWINSV